jgi:hypothetical protein
MHGLLRIARRGALPALLGAACAHEAPFIPEDPNTFVPFADTEPARLTLSGFPDVGPVWLPDGESFIYSYTNIDSPERDRCLGVLSWNGGQRLREICRRTLADRDSIDVLDLPAVSPGGRLVYLRSAATLFDSDIPRHTELVAGTLDEPLEGPVLRSIPFLAPDGAFYVGLSQPRWVGESGLVFIGQVEEIVAPCPGCDPEVIRVNAGIVYLAADGSGSVTLLPGTEAVTSVAVDGTGVLLTRAGDTRIFRRSLTSGEETVAHDVAIAEPTDLAAAGEWIVARIPGALYVLNLATGASVQVGLGDLLQPAINAQGTYLVGALAHAETFDPDIWRLTLP